MQQVAFQSKINDSKTSFILYLRLLAKTTRCFEENDTLFWRKRHVVLRNYGWIEEGLSNNPFMDLFFRGLCNHCDTCDSKKAKTPVMRAYACARKGLVIGLFTLRKTLFGMSCSSIVFSASEHPWKTTRHFPQNDTSFS